jgi:hypothetical protein
MASAWNESAVRPPPLSTAQSGTAQIREFFPIMKLSTTLAVLVLSAITAHAGLPLGRGELGFGATAGATYDSNLFGSPAATGDLYGTVTPLLTYARRAALIQASAEASISVLRYVEQTALDSENVNTSLKLQLDEGAGSKLFGSVAGGYHENSDVDTDLNRRVRTKAYTLAGRGTLVTGVRTDLGFSGNYGKTLRSVASDQETLNGELAFNYKQFLDGYTLRFVGDYNETKSSGKNLLGAKLNQTSYQGQTVLQKTLRDVFNVYAGYGYRVLNRSSRETTAGQTRLSGPLFTAGIEGPFLPPKYFPKIKSSFNVAYSEAAAPGINDAGSKSLAGSLSLNWQARPTTTVGLTATRGQRLSADDLTVQSTAVQFTVEQKLRYNLTGKLGGGYDWESFRGIGRSDRIITAQAALTYAFARRWNANLAYRLNSATSTRAASVFDRHVMTASVGYFF